MKDEKKEIKIDTAEEIKKIMTAYLQQEVGNKVTQFSVEGLTMMLLGVVKEK